MKNSIKTLSLILLLTLTIFSCKKEKDDDSANDSASQTITLKIDNEPEINYTDATGVVLSDKLVMGGNKSGSDIQISVDSDIAEGTYTSATQVLMSHGVNGIGVFTTATNVTSISFKVTGHSVSSKHIKGEFSINYTDNQNAGITHTATGTFDISYH